MKDKKYSFSSMFYKDYEKLFHYMSKQVKVDSEKQTKLTNRERVIGGRVSMVLGAIMILMMLYSFFSPYNNFDASDLKSIPGTLTYAKHHEGRKKRKDSFVIKMKEYPEYSFTFSAYGYNSVAYKPFLASSKLGDIVVLDILNISYDKKISQARPLNFWDKTVNYHRISAYGLKLNNQSYFSFNHYNALNKGWLARLGMIFLFGLSLFMVINGYLLTQNRGIMLKES